MANDENLISTIGIGVKVDTEKATKDVEAFIATLKKIGDVKGATLNKGVVNRLNELSEALAKFKNFRNYSPTDTFDKLASSIQKLSGVSKASISKTLPERITAISESLKLLRGADLTRLERLVDALVKIGSVTDAKIPKITGLSTATKAVKAISNGADMGKVSKKGETASGESGKFELAGSGDVREKLASIEVTRRFNIVSKELAKTIGSHLANGIKRAGAELGKFSMNITAVPFKRLASAVGNAIKRLGGFLSAIKRIALYRAIRTALKEITQGFREGMQNLYQYSLLINGTFKDSMDSLATSALYLKNSLGAMVSPIVNALAPAVDYLVDKFVDLLNVFNELIASLTGASTWTKALKYPTQYADEMDKAGGSAKKLRATLLGFDEINRLDDNSKGGRGSGGDLLDYSKMFEEQDVSSTAKNWADKLKKAISGEEGSIGQVVGETITNAVNNYTEWMDNIDWTGLGETIATNLNDAIKYTDSKKVGGALATTVNSGIKSLNGFVSKVDWDAYGKFISDGINGFFDEVNTKELGETISKGISGALKSASSFLTNLDVAKIGKKVGDLIRGIDWGSVISGLGSLIATAIRKLPDIAKGGLEVLNGIKDGILQAIPSLANSAWEIVKAVWDGISDNFTLLLYAGKKFVTKIVNGIGEKIGDLVDKGKEFIDKVCEGISNTASKVYEWGKTVISKFIDGINQGIKDKGSQLKRSVATVIENALGKIGINIDIGGEGGTYTVIGGRALGGSVQTGDLFYANEHEPELIAHVGNRTQVANNDQITESIRLATQQGNAESNMLLREAVSLLGGILAKDNTSVTEITASSITDGLRRQNLRNGRTTVAVG